MKISLVFSEEDGDELSGVLGNITLEKYCTKISEESAYIESWIEVLIDGLRSMQRNQNFIGDLVEEPEPLVFSREGSRVKLKYKADEIVLESADELKSALLCASNELVQRLKCDTNVLKESPIFKKIIEFVELSK